MPARRMLSSACLRHALLRCQARGLSSEPMPVASVCWPSMMFSITERCGISRMFWNDRDSPARTRLRGGRSWIGWPCELMLPLSMA